MKSKRLSWKPIRKGEIYCSPGCGSGCTYKSFTLATIKGNQLANALGPKWKPKVWENMGWFYSAVIKNGEVHFNKTVNSCWADLRIGKQQFLAGGKTPLKAYKNALNQAMIHIRAEILDYDAISKT